MTGEILLIEDNPISRKAVRTALQAEGFTIVEAADAGTSLKLMAQHLPDLVLQDLLLPDMNGFELVSQLRALPGAGNIPILALTGLMGKDDERRIADAQFTDYLFKPVEPSLLVSTIRTYLASKDGDLPKPIDNRRVLVIDDEPTQLKLFATYLRQLGFDVVTAMDGFDGLIKARNYRPDAIASDILMPGMDGFELCMNLRSDPELAGIPVVLLSNNYLQEADRQLAQKVGARALVEITPDFRDAIDALQNLEDGLPVAADDGGSIRAAHQERLARQLDRHVTLSAQLARRCATQSAQISVLARLGEDLLKGNIDGRSLLDDLLAQYLDALGFSCGAIYLSGPEKKLVLSAQIGFPNEVANSLPTFFDHQEMLHDVIIREEPLSISSAPGRHDPFTRLLSDSRSESLLVSPLRFGGDDLGVIVLTSGAAHLNAEWLAFSKAVTNQIGQAIALSRAISKVRYLASYDSLTGLPNRAHLRDRLEAAISDGRRSALYLLNVHRFEEINNTLSYRNGDRLLQQIARRLSGIFSDRAIVARLGADEFAVWLREAPTTALVQRAADDIINSLKPTFYLDGLPVTLHGNIGIALVPDGAVDAESLLSRADMAQRAARRSGQDYLIYPDHVVPYSSERLALLGELRNAIEHDKLVLHYQPKIDFKTARTVGVEALLRWPHPNRGWISPDQFIPFAEKAGLVHTLTLWVLRAAVNQARQWKDAGINIGMAVNVSARDLEDESFPEYIAKLCAAAKMPHAALTLELTERDLMMDPASAEIAIQRLSAIGVRLAIDDFGTGYSGLSYLQKLPVNEIKIDKSFVAGLINERRSVSIVRSVIDLGRNLDLVVVAEGVEDQMTWDSLAGLGCDMGQGYHISRPLEPKGLIQWLSRSPWPAAPDITPRGALRDPGS
jgi:diguanylate cyclase (GGDEF)-like protein